MATGALALPTMSLNSKRKAGEHGLRQGDSTTARLFLAFACFWPLMIMALFAASSPRVNTSIPGNASVPASNNLRMEIRNALDRVDIMGYGPTHPRVAVVVVGRDRQNLIASVESVFSKTDMDRIFVVTVVVDGMAEDLTLVQDLQKIDGGTIPHWHGQTPDLHNAGATQPKEEEAHGRKVHVIFNARQRGVTASRADGVEFIRLLSEKHEQAALKSPQEDLLLLLMEGGTQLESRRWLLPVTQALIVPPPLLGKEDSTVAMKLANAVSFNLEGPGKRTSFDETLAAVISESSAEDMNQNNGDSYPTPALNGAAIALRLDTYLNLPIHDESLQEAWPANLDLAMNLWLCADGIDMLEDAKVTSIDASPPAASLLPQQAARFAAAWMDETLAKKFFNAYTKTANPDMTYLEWETFQSAARQEPGFTAMTSRCRDFKWFIDRVNPELGNVLQASEELPKGKPMAANSETSAKSADAVEGNAKTAERANENTPLVPGKTPLHGERNDKERQEVDESEEEFVIPERHDQKKPTKPLCKECLEIVQRARPVEIAYVDMSNGHREDPHRGARDTDGNFGYTHDETALRKNPPAINFMGDDLARACSKRDNNYRMLHEKVKVDFKAHAEAEKSLQKRDKIFCGIYSIESAHPRIQRIAETWGQKCDGFIVASNKTDATLNTVDIPHEGPEDYSNMWQKIRSMLSYIYDNYYEKYDWFHMGGDDLYILVENLRLYLESEEIKTAANGGIYLPDGTETTQVPLFLGRRFAYMGDMNDIFNSGGSGYTMNKAALKTLVVDGFPNLFSHAHTFSEDTMVARTFRHYNIFPYETKDENGGERYMPFMPGHHYGYRFPTDKSTDWYAKYSINIKEGLDHCAAHSVAFHYVKDEAMYRLHALLYGLCPAEPALES
jgi:glycoprotein-N-acetylgalactosamine 3-beta-galactosyltransferase